MQARTEPDVAWAIERLAALLPTSFGDVELASDDGAVWIPGFGLVANVWLRDTTDYQGPAASVLLASPTDLPELDAILTALEAAVARLRAPGAARRALKRPIAKTLRLRAVSLNVPLFTPTAADEDRRERALEEAFRSFNDVAERMKQVYGLRLPRHVAVWAAFVNSLSPLEAAGLNRMDYAPCGIMVWFERGGLERLTRDGLDPRLEMRFRCDPPELVTVMSGGSDGLHFGLWYDDPAELPSCIARNYARDSAETMAGEETALEQLDDEVWTRIEEPDYPEEPIPLSRYALAAALTWFRAANQRAVDEDGPPRWADAPRGAILGGLAPALPDDTGAPRTHRGAYEARYAAYKDDSKEPQVRAWIAEAQAEIARGKPAFALVLGRELHWFDAPAYRDDARSLLCAAYRALGRDALGEITEVHYAHRDLPMVGVFV
jgi:hypothetical protein